MASARQILENFYLPDAVAFLREKGEQHFVLDMAETSSTSFVCDKVKELLAGYVSEHKPQKPKTRTEVNDQLWEALRRQDFPEEAMPLVKEQKSLYLQERDQHNTWHRDIAAGKTLLDGVSAYMKIGRRKQALEEQLAGIHQSGHVPGTDDPLLGKSALEIVTIYNSDMNYCRKFASDQSKAARITERENRIETIENWLDGIVYER